MYSEHVEDYLETIYNLQEETRKVKTKDVSTELGVSAPTVTEMLKKLDKDNLIDYQPYYGATLTEKGERVALQVKERNEAIKNFLHLLMIPKETAEEDACKLEHDLSPRTIQQVKKFVGFMKESPSDARWLEHFRQYCEKGTYACKKEVE